MKSRLKRVCVQVFAMHRGRFLSVSFLLLGQLVAGQGWLELPNTQLQSVCPANNFGGYNYAFNYYCKNVIDAWSGGVADTTRNRLIIWGGGHNDYYGNELYSLNLGNSPVTLTRLNDPSPPADPLSADCPAALADGRPNSRHTYSNLAYMSHVDKMFVYNGPLACGNAAKAKDTWTLDLATLQWQRMDPVNGPTPPGNYYGKGNANAFYDPITQTVFLHWEGGLWQYRYETNTYTLLKLGSAVPYSSNGVLDPQRRLLIFMGPNWQQTTPQVYAIDLRAGSSYAAQDWSNQVSGCDPLASALYPGLAYDSTLGRIVGWPNAGGTVYVFDPDTKTCVAHPFSGGPQNPAPVGSGTFGRFAYFPALGRYAVVTKAGLNAFSLSLNGTPPPDTVPPSVSLTAPEAGATVGGTVKVSAVASDNVGISSIEFILDGVSLGTVSTSPFSTNWDSRNATNGSHEVRAVARDGAGNSTTSETITVTVSNTLIDGNTLGVNGLGGSTLTCVDRDGDSFGTGEGCPGPDADDLDSAVQTAAQGITKYGTLNGLLSRLGYRPVNIWYISVNGNDSTGRINRMDLPYQTYSSISSQVAPGDMIMFRQGTYTLQAAPPNGAPGNPVILMSYPGELATFDGIGAGIRILDRSYLIVDGFKFRASCMSGGTYDLNLSSTFHDNVFRHVESTSCHWGFIAANGLINITIEDSSFHDNPGEHGIYIGSRNHPSSNVTVRRTLLYNNNYNGFQFNGRVSNLVVEQNISYGNLLSGFSLLNGVTNSFIRSNLAFNNGRTGILFYNYDGNCYDSTTAQTICPSDQRDNVVENNTIYNSGKNREGQDASGQPALQVANGVTGRAPNGDQVVDPKVGDMGHNTFRNNILVSWGGSNHYPPVVFNDADKDYLATSTFVNNLFYQNDGLGGSGVIGLGPGVSYGFAPYDCAAAARLTNISGCSVEDPKFTSASTSFWSSSVSFDFRLQSSSPAAGAGSSTGGAPYDLIGRLFAAPRSLGAYEIVGGSPPPNPSCDLNGDGTINRTDVEAAVSQALGHSLCTTGDLQPDGRCDVIDVQRFVIASMGAACITGQ